MKGLFKLIFLVLLGFSGIYLLFSLSQSVDKMEIYFFYMEICHSCDSSILAEEFSEIVDRLSRNNNEISGESLNIINEDNARRKKEVLELKNISQLSYVLPLLIIGESFFVGYEEIGEKLFELENRLNLRNISILQREEHLEVEHRFNDG